MMRVKPVAGGVPPGFRPAGAITVKPVLSEA